MATSVNTVLFKSQQLANGKYPVYIKIRHEGKRKQISLGQEFAAMPKDWDPKQGLFKKKRGRSDIDELNDQLTEKKQRIRDIINEFEKSAIPWSFNMLQERMDNKPVSGLFCELSQKFVDTHHHLPTKENNKYLRNSFINFCEDSNINFDQLICSEIDYSLMQKYYDYSMDKGLSFATIRARFKFISSTLNLAIGEGVANKITHPFHKRPDGKFFDLKRIGRVTTHKTLPLQNMRQLQNFKAYQKKDLYWQMYLFQCYSGMISYPTMIQLKYSDISFHADENGTLRQGIKVWSKQFRKEVTYFLTPEMLTILADIKANYELKKGLLFPILNDEEPDHKQLMVLKKVFHMQVYCCKNELKVPFDAEQKHDPEYLAKFNIRFFDKYKRMAVLLWSFSHYINGVNLIDMTKLKRSDIKSAIDQNGNKIEYFHIIRSKTKQEIIATLSRPAKDILQFFADHKDIYPTVGDYLFPILDKDYSLNDTAIHPRKKYIQKRLNAALQEIAAELNWPEELRKIAMNWARHSFSQRAMDNGAAKEWIQNALGHRDISTTENYLEGFSIYSKNDFNEKMFADDKIAT